MNIVNKRFKYSHLIVPLLIVLAFTVLLWSGNKTSIKNDELLKQHKIFTIGILSSYNFHYSTYFGSYSYKYMFSINGQNYEGGNLTRANNDIGNAIVNKKFPVIYDSLEPNNSIMLIFPRDFQDFGLSYPDSLNWVKYIAEKFGCRSDYLIDTIK